MVVICEVEQFFPRSGCAHSFTFYIFDLGLRNGPQRLVLELDVLLFL